MTEADVASRGYPSNTIGSIARYLAVGVLSFAFDLGVLSFCYTILGLPLWLSTTAGFWTAFVVNFGLNRRVTFRSGGAVGVQVVRYMALVIANYVVSVVLVAAAEAVGLGYAVGKTFTVALLMSLNYLAYRYWVFK